MDREEIERLEENTKKFLNELGEQEKHNLQVISEKLKIMMASMIHILLLARTDGDEVYESIFLTMLVTIVINTCKNVDEATSIIKKMQGEIERLDGVLNK